MNGCQPRFQGWQFACSGKHVITGRKQSYTTESEKKAHGIGSYGG